MPGWVIRARPPRGEPTRPPIVTDPEVLASRLEDAAHVPGGRAAGLVIPANEADVAAVVRSSAAVLPIGAQSSLTGGATPRGELLLSLARLRHIGEGPDHSVLVGAGVILEDLDRALAAQGRAYPPMPTFTGAFVGGVISTNAAGPATFKHGSTRDWVEALTLVLASGDVLDVQRGSTIAHPDGYFEIVLRERTARVPVPRYRLPAVAKCSAGYFAGPGMDLIDLFIGAEGTLGVVTGARLRVSSSRPASLMAFVPFGDRGTAVSFVRHLRDAAAEMRRTGDSRGMDVSAIEHMDARSLSLLREDGVDRATGVAWPDDTAVALLITLDLPSGTRADGVYAEIGRALEPGGADTPVVRFCRALAREGVLADVAIAVPGDARRASQLRLLREGVPVGVNRRVGRAQVEVDARIEKTAADMIVNVESFEALLAVYDRAFERRGLDVAVWGHISDGNVHPNVIPRSWADVERGREAILEIGREVVRLGGSPLAEHGVGRNPVKQQLLRELYGTQGIEDMRRVKRALDPDWKLAPGVLFPVG